MKNSPCKNCPERFIACSGNCPKDLRGEYGYQTWLAEVHKEKAVKKEWKKQLDEDFKRDTRQGFTTKKWRR
jgi:hypothetical protein